MLRRRFLAAACAAVALPALRLSAAEPPPRRFAIHLLDRLGFGPAAGGLAHVEAVGAEAYIAAQLHPETIAEPASLGELLAPLDTLSLDPVQLFLDYGPQGPKASPEERKARRQRARIIVEQAQAARVFRALYSPRQLQEAMVDFWYNHFNVFAGKGLDHLWVGAYERDAIRPHALGRFRDLVLATARSPAMLFYLDNWENSAPGSTMPNGRSAGLNENYARELMELHTLGVDGGYTQADVVALARILTGWGFVRPRMRPPDRSGFHFEPARHDFSEKRFLGRTISPTGESEGIEAIGLLAQSPATARHIAFELAQYFVADAPPPGLVERLAQRFLQSDGDIRAVLAALFASREFRDSAGRKYKTPYRYVLSAARAAGVEVRNPRPLLGAMARLGMPLYFCQTPDGYKNTEAAWLGPEATNVRIGFAAALASGRLPLDREPPAMAATPVAERVPAPVDAAALERLLAPVLSPHTREVVAGSAPPLRAALLLGSPDFMRH